MEKHPPDQVRCETLLDRLWRMIDPTDASGQCVDRGTPYPTAIFYHDENEKRLAEQSLAALIPSGRFTRPVVTAIAPLTDLYPAEAGHHPPLTGMDTWQRSVLKNCFSCPAAYSQKKRSGHVTPGHGPQGVAVNERSIPNRIAGEKPPFAEADRK